MIGERIFFSSSNEDGNSEIVALGPKGKRVLCIAGSGSRAFDLLLAAPREVIAIDASPAQASLAELQACAMKLLSHPQFLAFVGVDSDGDRLATYRSMRGLLSPETATFWDRNESSLRSGIIYAGKWERIFGLMGHVLGLAGGRWRNNLFQAKDLDEQFEIWKKRDNRLMASFYRLASNRWLWQYIVRDPGIRLVSKTVDIPQYFLERNRTAVRRHLFRECPLAWLMFYGRFASSAALPLYLRAENYESIRSRLQSLTLVRSNLINFLKSDAAGSFDAFSLSDFSSYTGETEYHDTWNWIAKKSNPGARFCERSFLVRYPTSPVNLLRDTRLSEQLEAQDKAFFYSISCGTIGSTNGCHTMTPNSPCILSNPA